MERFNYPIPNDQFDDACDLDALLHPCQAFEHPSNVVNDPDLTLNEKRAIAIVTAMPAGLTPTRLPRRTNYSRRLYRPV
jgi:hypothetical protein